MVLTRCSRVNEARNASAALRTGAVETPVDLMGKSPSVTLPLGVIPLNGSANPLRSPSSGIRRKRSR